MSFGVLWDLDGTLVDSEPVHAAAFAGAIAELGVEIEEGFHDQLLGASGDRVFEALSAMTGTALTFEHWTGLKWKYFQRASDLITRREPSAGLAMRLARKGVPMAIVSNSTRLEVGFGLKCSGLSSALSVTVCRDDVAAGKPAPDCYLLAARKLGLQPTDCLVVEDSIIGTRAGLAAGMTVLFHPQDETLAPPAGARFVPPQSSPEPFILNFLANGVSDDRHPHDPHE